MEGTNQKEKGKKESNWKSGCARADTKRKRNKGWACGLAFTIMRKLLV
jgi:hypothetical protein